MPRFTKQEIAESTEELRKLLPPGSTVYTIVTHVSRSGMSRSIRLYCIQEIDGKPTMRWISNYVARILGYPQDRRRGDLKVGGCGMDMCFHVVHSLSYALHGRADQSTWERGKSGEDKRHGYTLRKEDL